jgi:seryl-tRNA synthetase
MIDIAFIREHADLAKQAAEQKRVQVDIDRLLVVDSSRRELKTKLDEIQRQRNESAKVKDIEAGKRLKEEAAQVQEALTAVEAEFDALMILVPNIPSSDTPIGKDESENVVIRKFMEPTQFSFKPKHHSEIGKALNIIDNETASEVSGARFTYLKGDLALMQFALIQLVFNTLTNAETLQKIIDEAGLSVSNKPFIPVIPPVFIRPEVMQRMGRLEPRDERYHLVADDLFLVGSAEHTLGPMHMEQTFEEAELPVRYIGYSTAFRREAGSYGKDTKGIIRMHQFDKLEMETYSVPEKSTDEQNLIVAIQEYLVRQLKIPYQVVQICTGDMGKPDSRQIDLEMYMPGEGTYRETHTSDLMTDFQSRRLNIKIKRETGKVFAHMNDATAFAIGRTLVAIIENYQNEDGTITVPDVLRAYVGKDVIS